MDSDEKWNNNAFDGFVSIPCSAVKDTSYSWFDKNNSEESDIELNLFEWNKIDEKESNRIDLIKASAVIELKSNFHIFSSFKSIASTIYYNHFNNTEKFNTETTSYPIHLFSNKYHKYHKKEINFEFLKVLLMTYRNSFQAITSKSKKMVYTSDCGWGCMIRACQMMWSKGIIERKIYNMTKKTKEKIAYLPLIKLRDETLFLFYDNYIKIEFSLEHSDFVNFWNKYQKWAEKQNQYNGVTHIIPPYSIQTICSISNCAGNWTSDLAMIKAFIEINKQLINEMSFLQFQCGAITEKVLYEELCTEIHCSCEKNIENINEYNWIKTSSNSICENCLKKVIVDQKMNSNNILKYNNKKYIFSKSGLIFISFRLGLQSIEPEYVEPVRNIFAKISNNIGFVSGKDKKAFYFVGIANGQLMYWDPHLNQKASLSNGKDNQSYFVRDIYLMDIKDMSSELTLGVLINNEEDLRTFISEIKSYSSQNEGRFIKMI